MSDFDSGIPYWGRVLIDRVAEIEKMQPAVMAERISNLASDVRSLRRAFYTFAFSVAASSAIFAITAFTVFGKP